MLLLAQMIGWCVVGDPKRWVSAAGDPTKLVGASRGPEGWLELLAQLVLLAREVGWCWSWPRKLALVVQKVGACSGPESWLVLLVALKVGQCRSAGCPIS